MSTKIIPSFSGSVSNAVTAIFGVSNIWGQSKNSATDLDLGRALGGAAAGRLLGGRGAGADLADHDQAGGDADARLQDGPAGGV